MTGLFPFLFSAAALAAALSIQPGQSVTVPAQSTEPTVVSCSAPNPPGAGQEDFSSEGVCFCRAVKDGFQLLRLTTTPAGERSEKRLKTYGDKKICQEAITHYPPCL